jgi:hypothetical protein
VGGEHGTVARRTTQFRAAFANRIGAIERSNASFGAIASSVIALDFPFWKSAA